MLKSSIFKFSIWALLLLSASTTASAGEEGLGKENLGKESSEEDSLTRYDRRILRYRKHWDVLMPTQSVIQTCGNMGIISLGIGWDYGKRSQWETHLLFGIVPKYDSDEVKMTMERLGNGYKEKSITVTLAAQSDFVSESSSDNSNDSQNSQDSGNSGDSRNSENSDNSGNSGFFDGFGGSNN